MKSAQLLGQVNYMASEEKDISEVLDEKGKDLKKILKEMDAKIEHWKFSIEESKEGKRVEVHITASVQEQAEEGRLRSFRGEGGAPYPIKLINFSLFSSLMWKSGRRCMSSRYSVAFLICFLL